MPALHTDSAEWAACKKHLRDQIPEPFYNMFIEPLAAMQKEDSTISLVVPEPKLRHHIELRYGSLLKEAILQHFPGQVSLVRIENRGETPVLREEIRSETIVPSATVQWDSTFLPHPAIREDLQALLRMRHSFRPIFLTGGSGSGKTVFARKWAAHFSKTAPAAVVGIQELVNGFVSSLRSQSTMDWKKNLRQNELLLIDDLQLLKPSAARSQEELRNLMDDFERDRHMIVFLSDRDPSRLPLGRDLKSRIMHSQQIHLLYPDQETRRTILRECLAADGLEIRDDLLDHLARRIPQDMRLLHAAVHRLRFLGSDPRRLTREEIDRLCEPLYHTEEHSLRPENILETVARFFQVTAEEIKGPGKDKRIALARHVASFLCSKMTGLTLSEIARVTNRKDHTGVLYALNRVERLMEQDLFLNRQIEEIKEKLLMEGRPD